MTVADILDGAFAVLKGSPARIIGVVAVFVVPVQILAAFLQRDILNGQGLSELIQGGDASLVAASNQNQSASATFAPFLLLLGQAVVLPFAAGAIMKLVSGWYAGRDPSFGELLGAVGRKWWVLFLAWCMVHLVEGVFAIACFLPALIPMTWFCITAPVAMAEDLGPVAAMKRSYQLTKRRFWPSLGVCFLTGVVAYMLDQVLGLVPDTVALIIGTDVGWPLLAVGGVLSQLITMPLVAAGATLLYLDLRVRSEGLDIELDAIDLFDRAPS
jgi:hypothetical protein